MAEKKQTGLPLDSNDPNERSVWATLGEAEMSEPSDALRQSFYRKLEQASRPTAMSRLRDLIGFSGNTGWITAAACLLVGVAIGIGTGGLAAGGGSESDTRLAALEENVTLLNRRLILDRLENETPSKRLRGVFDAAGVAGDDAEIARALLVRATEDRVGSVRAAAINALGPSIKAPAVGEQLMPLLQQAESPIVQLALVDLVLRYGDGAQLDQVLSLARSGQLHPDLQRYVITALEGDTA